MQRIGVFVCWCGSNIAGTVDVKAVSEALKNEPGVVFSTNYQYMCSQAGQNLIKDAIKEHHLTGIVVCSCSPRMHENTFRKTAQSAGINPYMVEIANVREQCSWVHKDMATGTEKAIILGKAAVAKVNLNTPLTPGESPVTKRALVIGGGIAGIQTALDIADAGFPVDIVETKPTIGGKMAQLDKTFPTLDCAACILTPKMVDVAQNENIRIFSCRAAADGITISSPSFQRMRRVTSSFAASACITEFGILSLSRALTSMTSPGPAETIFVRTFIQNSYSPLR